MIRSPLAIKRVDAIPVALPLIKPMTLARVRLTASTNLLVRITARNGAVGWGEAVAMPTPRGENLAAMMRAMAQIGPYLVGQDAGSYAILVATLARRRGQSYAALSAADMALLDLVGQAANLPVGGLLGGRLRDHVTPMWLIGSPTVEADVAEAKRQRRRGYTVFKIKVGAKPLTASIAATNALRQALGNEVTLCADANMNLNPRAAAEYLRGVAKSGLLYLEQPFPRDQIASMARISRTSKIALGIDEAVEDVADIVAHYDARAARGVAIKSITLGSLAATVAAASVADALGMAVNISAKIAESSVGAAALLHVASAVGNTAWGVSPTNCYVAEDIVRNPIALRRGRIAVPDGGGLGVEVDPAAVQRLRIR